MSLDLDLQKDLHEAFRLLYDDEEDLDFGADWDEDEDDVQVPMNNTPPAEVEIPSTKYSKKRLQAMLDALIPSDPSYQPTQKRRRLLPTASNDPTLKSISSSTAQPLFSPNSTTSYRSRLLSYTLPTYSSKPESLRPQNVARYGWKNAGRERIQCETCGSAWVIKGLNDPKLVKARARLVELYEQAVRTTHTKYCPWRIQQSPPSIHYQLLSLQPPLSSQLAPIAREIDSDYLKRDVKGSTSAVQVAGGLSSDELQNLLASLQTVTPTESPEILPLEPSDISAEAANLSFFGWRPYRPAASSSKASVVVVPEQPPAAVPDVLHCAICDRKIGLFNFRDRDIAAIPTGSEGGETKDAKGKKRVLDVRGEHREFCPIKVYAEPLTTDGSREDDARKEQELNLGIERPWWRSAVILRAPDTSTRQDMHINPGMEMSSGTPGDKMTKQQVLLRLKEILGEKDTRLSLRGRM